MKPFIKWAGGKYRLADKLIQYLPSKFDSSRNTYIEPMVGSGGFFFKHAPKQAYLSDINENLINTYNIIKNDVESLILKLEMHQSEHADTYFYEMRDEFNKLVKEKGDPVDVAALFIYLNRTCFNGLYRENSNVFAYYVLGGILMNNVNLFLKWCFINNTSLFQFSNNPMNVNKFIDLIIKEHNNSTLLRTINKLFKK